MKIHYVQLRVHQISFGGDNSWSSVLCVIWVYMGARWHRWHHAERVDYGMNDDGRMSDGRRRANGEPMCRRTHVARGFVRATHVWSCL